jgi:hypothetical protein
MGGLVEWVVLLWENLLCNYEVIFRKRCSYLCVPLLKEVCPRDGHAAPDPDLHGHSGQELLPCRRGCLRGGLLRSRSVGGVSLFQPSCTGTDPSTL